MEQKTTTMVEINNVEETVDTTNKTLDEAKTLIETIDEVIEEGKELKKLEEPKDKQEVGVEVKEDTSIPTTQEAQQYVDELNAEQDAEDGKTLLEHLYESEEEKLIAKSKEEEEAIIDSTKLPDIVKEEQEKQKVVEEMSNDIEKIVTKKKKPEEIIEELSEMFFAKEERLTRELKLSQKRNEILEEIVDKITEENNKMKYNSDKVEISDNFMGTFVTLYKESKEKPDDENIKKKLGALFISGAGSVYPEITIDSVTKLINTSREENMNKLKSLTGGSEKEQEIKEEVLHPKPKRTVGYVIGNS